MKILVSLLVLVAVLAGATYLFREDIIELMSDSFTEDMFVDEDDDPFDPGPAVGETLPDISAEYQGETLRRLERFSGERGLLLLLNRSLDWCIFCKRQALELNQGNSSFLAEGLGLVMLVYDKPDVRDSFAAEHQIQYPILSDIDAASVTALGVLNEEYAPGDGAYGIPHPGAIILSPAGQVVGKLFLEPYAKRLSSPAILRQALEWLPQAGAGLDGPGPGGQDDASPAAPIGSGSATIQVMPPDDGTGDSVEEGQETSGDGEPAPEPTP